MSLLPKKSRRLAIVVPLAVCAAAGAAHADPSISVTTPDTLSGRAMVTDSAVTDGIPQQKQALSTSVPKVSGTVVAVYGSKQAGNVVGVNALAAPIDDPAGQLTAGLNAMGQHGMQPLTGVADVAPGPLGGSARCGSSSVDDRPIVVCGWADRGSLGYLTWYSKTAPTDARNEFATLRGQIEHAG